MPDGIANRNLAGESSPGNLCAAIGGLVGDMDTFLRAHGTTSEAYAEKLAKRRPPGFDLAAERQKNSAAYQSWLRSELDEAIELSAREFQSLGCDANGIAQLSRKAWRSDLGTVWVKGLFSNAAAYGLVSAVSLALTIPLGLVLGPLPMIAVTLGLSVFATYKWAVHALPAGTTVANALDASKRPDGTSRQRFSKTCVPGKLRTAVGRELAADLLGRTGPRLAITTPLRVLATTLDLLGVATSFASILGTYVIGPVAAIIGPPTNASMQVVSKVLDARKGGRTMAPLCGISLDEDGRIAFDPKQPRSNLERLARPGYARAGSTCAHLASEYVRGFPGAVKAEKKKGMTVDKKFELICGGNTLGPLAAAGAGLAATHLGTVAGPVMNTVGKFVSTAMGASNVATRGNVHKNSRVITHLKESEKSKAPPSPGPAAAALAPRERTPQADPFRSQAPSSRPLPPVQTPRMGSVVQLAPPPASAMAAPAPRSLMPGPSSVSAPGYSPESVRAGQPERDVMLRIPPLPPVAKADERPVARSPSGSLGAKLASDRQNAIQGERNRWPGAPRTPGRISGLPTTFQKERL
jgi:hypothetical protein